MISIPFHSINSKFTSPINSSFNIIFKKGKTNDELSQGTFLGHFFQ